MLFNLALLLTLLCTGYSGKVGTVYYHLSSMTLAAQTMPNSTFASPAAWDSNENRLWVMGGRTYDYCCVGCTWYCETATGVVQYIDLDNNERKWYPNKITVKNWNYNGNSMVFHKARKELWYATNQQMCKFDVANLIETCLSNWNYPTNNYNNYPVVIMNPITTTALYVIPGSKAFWMFDISISDSGSSGRPWKTGPSQSYTRYSYPCGAFYNGYIYVVGGSYETTATERINITAFTPGSRWKTYGSLQYQMYGSNCVAHDRLLYVMGGEMNYDTSVNIIVYDMGTGKSKTTDVYINEWRMYFGGALVNKTGGSAIYILNGYAWNYNTPTYSKNTIEYSNTMTLPTPAPTFSPTRHPTKHPTKPPTRSPSRSPTRSPSRSPTSPITKKPTKLPTYKPSKPPTKKPTTKPPTVKPTRSPTRAPTAHPTRRPTKSPTRHPSQAPTGHPTPRIAGLEKISFDFWLRSWVVSQQTFDENYDYRFYVSNAIHEALVQSIKNEVTGVPAYWQYLFNITILKISDSTDGMTTDPREKVTLCKVVLQTDTSKLYDPIMDVLTDVRKIKTASRQATSYLQTDFNDFSMVAYFEYDGLSGQPADTNAPSGAPTSYGKAQLAESKGVTNEAWFWVLIIATILIFFFGAMALYLRHTSKKDKLRRQQNMMAIQKLASLSGSVPMNALQAQQQQALTHSLWLGGNGTGGTNTNSSGEAGENGGEGGGNHTQLLNDMLASKLKSQQANQASLAIGGNNGGMGLGSAPMGMGMGMNPMGMGMGMGMNPMMMAPQLYNPSSIAGDLNNYMFNPALMNMGMNWQEMAQMVSWQNQMLMAQANGKALNPAMLSTDALNIGGEDANGLNLSGGENDDPNASNKLVDAMKLNTSDDGEKIGGYEE